MTSKLKTLNEILAEIVEARLRGDIYNFHGRARTMIVDLSLGVVQPALHVHFNRKGIAVVLGIALAKEIGFEQAMKLIAQELAHQAREAEERV